MYFLIRKIKVDGANAVSGLLYGFPSVTHFLGFTHALSRKLQAAYGLSLSGCGVISHGYQVLGHRGENNRDLRFSLSRNPLKRDGTTPAFMEEGKLHMEVSLLIRCDFQQSEVSAELLAFLTEHMAQQKLAGGLIADYQSAEFLLDDGEKSDARRILRKLLPGFALMDRTHLLAAHHAARIAHNPEAELMDSWADFFTMRHCAVKNDAENADSSLPEGHSESRETVTWQRVEKPAPGWLVPTMNGYRGISPVFQGSDVANSRDGQTPFRLAEAVYSIGEWMSPHRLSDPSQLIWSYSHHQDDYLAVQTKPTP